MFAGQLRAHLRRVACCPVSSITVTRRVPRLSLVMRLSETNKYRRNGFLGGLARLASYIVHLHRKVPSELWTADGRLRDLPLGEMLGKVSIIDRIGSCLRSSA
jgi:hypothetical protein